MSDAAFPTALRARFEPESLLAEGGFGAVWIARQQGLDRRVAVKILRVEAAGANDAARRFEDEARVTAALRHPNIVTLLDHGVADGTPWMAFELIEGASLRSWVERGPSPWNEVVEAARQIAGALETARRAGVVHRDIKPDNVLASDGRYKVADFGIAKWGGASVQTAAGLILGTPAYIAPELARGEPPTHLTDLYALGVTIFELTTGQLPFDGDSPMIILQRHLMSAVPSLTRLAPDAPPALDAVVARLMAKEPAQRFATGAELEAALAKVAANGGAPAVPREAGAAPPPSRGRGAPTRPIALSRSVSRVTSAVQPPAAPPARSAWPAAVAGAAAVLIAAGAFALRPPAPVPSPTPASAPASQVPTPAPTASALPAEKAASVAPLLEEVLRLTARINTIILSAPQEEDITAPDALQRNLATMRLLVTATRDSAAIVRKVFRYDGPDPEELLRLEDTMVQFIDTCVQQLAVSSAETAAVAAELKRALGDLRDAVTNRPRAPVLRAVRPVPLADLMNFLDKGRLVLAERAAARKVACAEIRAHAQAHGWSVPALRHFVSLGSKRLYEYRSRKPSVQPGADEAALRRELLALIAEHRKLAARPESNPHMIRGTGLDLFLNAVDVVAGTPWDAKERTAALKDALTLTPTIAGNDFKLEGVRAVTLSRVALLRVKCDELGVPVDHGEFARLSALLTTPEASSPNRSH